MQKRQEPLILVNDKRAVNFRLFFLTAYTHHFYPQELLGVVEARLQQLRQVVVLGGADEARDVGAGQGAGAGVQVVEQQPERLGVELDDVELHECTSARAEGGMIIRICTRP